MKYMKLLNLQDIMDCFQEKNCNEHVVLNEGSGLIPYCNAGVTTWESKSSEGQPLERTISLPLVLSRAHSITHRVIFHFQAAPGCCLLCPGCCHCFGKQKALGGGGGAVS